MFFVIGVNQGKKELDFSSVITCPFCGNFGRARIFAVYSQLMLFFIPTFKWGKRYYLKMDCCGAVYELDQEKGKQIEDGFSADLSSVDLKLVRHGASYAKTYCVNCGREIDSSFEFCPYCGKRI